MVANIDCTHIGRHYYEYIAYYVTYCNSAIFDKVLFNHQFLLLHTVSVESQKLAIQFESEICYLQFCQFSIQITHTVSLALAISDVHYK